MLSLVMGFLRTCKLKRDGNLLVVFWRYAVACELDTWRIDASMLKTCRRLGRNQLEIRDRLEM